MLARGGPLPPRPLVTPGPLPWPAAAAAMAAVVIVTAAACWAWTTWLPRLWAYHASGRALQAAAGAEMAAARAAYIDQLTTMFRRELADRWDWPL
jgi:hypothetical protein